MYLTNQNTEILNKNILIHTLQKVHKQSVPSLDMYRKDIAQVTSR